MPQSCVMPSMLSVTFDAVQARLLCPTLTLASLRSFTLAGVVVWGALPCYNKSRGGWGGKAGAPGGNGIAHINGQAVVMAVAVAVGTGVVGATAEEEEEKEEEGLADCNVDRAAEGDGGTVTHGDRKDGKRSVAPRTRMMTMMTTAAATGGIGIVLR
jgi:hypothetical protein